MRENTYLITNLDLKPLFNGIEENSGSVFD